MYSVALARDADAEAFKVIARLALAQGCAPESLHFQTPEEPALFPALPVVEMQPLSVPRGFAELLDSAVCHSAFDRFAYLYEVLWRLKQGEPRLLSRASDPAMAALRLYAKGVGRDIHKMHAFLRFHEKRDAEGPYYIAWFEPQYFILKRAIPFFRDRFAAMRWMIATPIGTASWDGKALLFGATAAKPEGLEDDVLEEIWQTYYRTTFNPARVRLKAMQKEMPKHYWHNMPETKLIPGMIDGAAARVAAMDRAPDQAPRFAAKVAPVVENAIYASPIEALRAEAASCRACSLFGPATQTVFGEGPEDAQMMLVGEQPGDQEDLAGKPFIGPAGQMLDRALDAAGIPRVQLYITNAVKHFKYEPRGKIRLHKRPSTGDVRACGDWLSREIASVSPKLIVALGATAVTALAGRVMVLSDIRGKLMSWPDGRAGLVTIHPSYLLRLQDKNEAREEYARFVEELKLAARHLGEMRHAA